MKDARARHAAEIPVWYSWTLHACCDVVFALGVIAFAISRLENLTWVESLALPIGFVWANVGEYFLHRYPMHRPLWPLRFAYDRHAVVHHTVFTHEDMGMRSPRELRWVLFPAFTVPGLVLGMLPVALAVGTLVTPNAGWLTLVVTASYYLLYEFLHTAYHLPPDAWLARRPSIAFLRRLHQTHHHPRLMARANFNVTFPLSDSLFGTWRRSAPEPRDSASAPARDMAEGIAEPTV
jgi:sterol desaturase/sphingolipid hydroxylase (fatty acid hydroxylase superfamily)